MTSWTRVTDPDAAAALLPAWFAARMMATRGSYGFLLVTGDVLRVSRVTAVHVSSGGSILLDVLLDCAGVPGGGVDFAWQPKHFLGAPVPGATLATLNLAQVVVAIEFTAAEIAETETDVETPTPDAVSLDLPVVTDAIAKEPVIR
jgi:hypothetical protein